MLKDKSNWTHEGWFCGCVPIRADFAMPDCPIIEAKGGVLGEVLFDVAEFFFGMVVLLKTMIDPEYEPAYPLRIRPLNQVEK